jgi:hypothetical protein
MQAEVDRLEESNRELKAHVERLRDALSCDVMLCETALRELQSKPLVDQAFSGRRIDELHRGEHIKFLKHVYDETPSQSLAALKRKHYGECVEICKDEMKRLRKIAKEQNLSAPAEKAQAAKELAEAIKQKMEE